MTNQTNNSLSKLKRTAWSEGAAKEGWDKAMRILYDRALAAKLAVYQTNPAGFIEDVLHCVLTDDTRKVAQSVLENPVTIARSGNAVGKSYTAARIGIWWYKVFSDSQVYMSAAPPIENLKHILWAQVTSAIVSTPDLFRGDIIRKLSVTREKKRDTITGVAQESFMTGWSIPTAGTAAERESRFAGKHAPHLLFIVDEGDAVPEEVYKGIDSCMSGGFARLLIMFNPRIKSGRIYNMERQGLAKVVHLSALNHPNVITGNAVIPGAVTREKTLTRINEWTRPLAQDEKPSGDCFDVPNFLVNTTTVAQNGMLYPPLQAGVRKVTEPAFNYMVMGEYPALGEQQLISSEWIDNARTRYDAYVAMHGLVPPQGVRPTLSLDVAEFGSDANVCCIRYGGLVLPFITWSGVDVDFTTTRALELYIKYNCHIAYIDATGVGASVAPSMARQGRKHDVRAVAVKVASAPSTVIKSDLGKFKILRDQLWWAVREGLRTDPGYMLPPDNDLISELLTPSYSVPRGDIQVTDKESLRKVLKRSPNKADALCLSHSPSARATILRLFDKSS